MKKIAKRFLSILVGIKELFTNQKLDFWVGFIPTAAIYSLICKIFGWEYFIPLGTALLSLQLFGLFRHMFYRS